MGRIFDHFGQLEYLNEADVSRKFLLPLLTDFLGYQADEIMPEHLLPPIEIPLNRKQTISSDRLPARAKPDYIVTFDQDNYVLVCDSKGPDEHLEDYIDQLIAYCIAARTNLLLITNGIQLRVYDANDLVFHSQSIEDLDLRYSQLYVLLNRTDAAQHTVVERLQRIDLPRALGKDAESLASEQKRRTAIALSDFDDYLRMVVAASEKLELPLAIRSTFQVDLLRFPAEQLYIFQEYNKSDLRSPGENPISYAAILREDTSAPLLLVGESGIGKSSLLQQLMLDQAQQCLTLEDEMTPVLIKLRRFGSGQSLNQLIADALISQNAAILQADLPFLLRDGRFLLLLDAFDEVFEPNIPELEQQIQALVEDYPHCKVVITTRDFRLPRVAPIRRYRLKRLSHDQIQAFAHMYLANNSEDFLKEIARRGLLKIASNTLLLTLLILLYRNNQELPISRGQIIKSVLERVHAWDESKGERFEPVVPWPIRIELLTQLAYTSVISDQSYAMDAESTETALAQALDELERRRKIRGGLELNRVLDILAATGFISRVETGVVFWHSVFLEFFAAIELARRLEAEPSLIESFVQKTDWEEILLLAIWKAEDPTYLIQRIVEHNVFTAGKALLECSLTRGTAYEQVIDELVDKCESATLPIRQIATLLLRQLEGAYADAKFYDLLKNQFVDVQKAALVEIARRKLPNAREVVFSRLNWDARAPTWREGSASNAVIEALGELDDAEAHLQIIAFWRKKPDMFTDESCHTALLRIASRNQIESQVRQALLDFYLKDEQDTFHGIKVYGIADVLIALEDPAIVPPLISRIEREQDRTSPFPWEAVKILASFSEQAIVEQLIEKSMKRELDAGCRAKFAEALSKSQGVVPIDVFQALAEDPDDRVRSQGVRGLGRFPFTQVQESVLEAIRAPGPDQTLESYRRYVRTQQAAFEVLAAQDQLEILLQEDNRPQYFSDLSLEILLDSISTNRLHSLIPLVRMLFERLKNQRTAVKVAWVFADLGYKEQAQKIIERFGQSTRDWIVADILQGIHRLPVSYSLEFIDSVLSSPEIEDERDSYLLMHCTEALERIGTSEACDRLARITETDLEVGVGVNAEPAIRAIEFLAPKEREKWLIELVEEYPHMPRHALRRALEALGVIGGFESLPLLQQHFQEPSELEVQLVCFWAIHSIYKRAGQTWYNGEEGG